MSVSIAERKFPLLFQIIWKWAALAERTFSLAANSTALTAAAPFFGKMLIYLTEGQGGGEVFFLEPQLTEKEMGLTTPEQIQRHLVLAASKHARVSRAMPSSF